MMLTDKEANQQVVVELEKLMVEEDQENTQRNVGLEEFSQLLESQPRKWQPGSHRRRQMDKVLPELRQRCEQSTHLYDPTVVSLGPYHHGKPELYRAEEFKHICLDWCARGDAEKKRFFYNKILEKIDEIRDCYSEVTIVEKYNDKALALMMLLDSCFVINHIENFHVNAGPRNNVAEWYDCLGVAAAVPVASRDMLLLENQIPFQVLKLLVSLQHDGEEKAQELLDEYVIGTMSVDIEQVKLTRRNGKPPLHLLEACWRARVWEKHSTEHNQRHVDNRFWSKFRWPRFLTTRKKTYRSYTSSSVMELKAKGIRFRRSSSHSVITFKSHAFYGELRLPARHVFDGTRSFYSNMIAYEVSPNREVNKPYYLSTSIFLKSLIQSVADVKELEEKGILVNMLGNHEQVVKLFHEMDTLGLGGMDMFKDIKERIEEHCNSKAKTWIADLINTRFRSPWTAIALFAAILLLCLTFLQTYFTIHPVK